MKLIAVLLTLKAGLALALPAPPVNTPSPMLPGASADCEGFFLASPGVSCWSMATEHGLSVQDFIHINPQIPPAGGCEGGGVVPHYWYCIKARTGTGDDVNDQSPTKVTFVKSETPPSPKPKPPPPAPKPNPPPVPEPSPAPDLRCEVTNCYRGFLRIVSRVRGMYRSFCMELLDKPCLAATIEELNAPNHHHRVPQDPAL